MSASAPAGEAVEDDREPNQPLLHVAPWLLGTWCLGERDMKKWIFCLVAGLVLLIIGVSLTGEPVVRCGGVPMSPGEVCRDTTGSGEVVARKTYDEVEKETEAAQRTRDTWSLGAFASGTVLILLAATGFAVRRRRRADHGPSPADLFFQRRAAAQAAPQPDEGPPTPGTDPGSGDDITQRPS